MADQYSANLGYDLGRWYNSDLTLGYNLYGTNNYQKVANDFDVNQNELFLLYRKRTYWNDHAHLLPGLHRLAIST